MHFKAILEISPNLASREITETLEKLMGNDPRTMTPKQLNEFIPQIILELVTPSEARYRKGEDRNHVRFWNTVKMDLRSNTDVIYKLLSDYSKLSGFEEQVGNIEELIITIEKKQNNTIETMAITEDLIGGSTTPEISTGSLSSELKQQVKFLAIIEELESISDSPILEIPSRLNQQLLVQIVSNFESFEGSTNIKSRYSPFLNLFVSKLLASNTIEDSYLVSTIFLNITDNPQELFNYAQSLSPHDQDGKYMGIINALREMGINIFELTDMYTSPSDDDGKAYAAAELYLQIMSYRRSSQIPEVADIRSSIAIRKFLSNFDRQNGSAEQLEVYREMILGLISGLNMPFTEAYLTKELKEV